MRLLFIVLCSMNLALAAYGIAEREVMLILLNSAAAGVCLASLLARDRAPRVQSPDPSLNNQTPRRHKRKFPQGCCECGFAESIGQPCCAYTYGEPMCRQHGFTKQTD